MDFFDAKGREAERIVFRGFEGAQVKDRCDLLVLNLSDHIVLFNCGQGGPP